MRHQNQHQTDDCCRLPISCYVCSEGCVHLGYGNMLATFTPQQFSVLADVIGKVHRQLAARAAQHEEDLADCAALVM